MGMGMGMENISWGPDGDGENFMGMGRGCGQFYLPFHSLVQNRLYVGSAETRKAAVAA